MEFGRKILEKALNLGPKALRKPGIWYLEKSGNLASIYSEVSIYSKPCLQSKACPFIVKLVYL